jgi:DNA-binding response OmpR family regulator
VLDLKLPRLDGVAILRFLRTPKPSMPILVLTGRTRVEDRVLCLELDAEDYLGKPCDLVSGGLERFREQVWNTALHERGRSRLH